MSLREAAQLATHRNAFLLVFRELLRIIRDYGMPTVAFGTGIYAFILVLELPAAPEMKAIIAGGLTLVGLLAQLWVFSRENPRVQSDEVREQLARMTNIVERLVESDIEQKLRSARNG